MNNWCVYLLKCKDNTYYCGITNDLQARVIKHNGGKGAKYTRGRGPVEVIGIVKSLTKQEAARIEYRVKRLRRTDKLLYFGIKDVT